jgi:Na+-driven multidrug efflux pump
MTKYSISVLFAAAFGAAFWAYTIIDTLIRAFHKDVSVIDLGALYVLGLFSGIMFGIIIEISRRKNARISR